MENETICNFEDIYYNIDGGVRSEQHTSKLLNDKSSKTSINCGCIYRYLFSWFFPSHINSLYK